MIKQYSIADARHNLAGIVHDLDRDSLVELTRRGQPVAVLLSLQEFERLKSKTRGYWDSFNAFRTEVDLESLKIEPDIWSQVRDQSSGREVS